jgi:hypothetical protein
MNPASLGVPVGVAIVGRKECLSQPVLRDSLVLRGISQGVVGLGREGGVVGVKRSAAVELPAPVNKTRQNAAGLEQTRQETRKGGSV